MTSIDPTGPLALSADNTGVSLQMLKGPSNYLRWSRDFQVVAQAKALWDYFSGRAEVIEKPNPATYGFGSATAEEEAETDIISTDPEDELIKKIKNQRKAKSRSSLLTSELDAIAATQREAGSSELPKPKVPDASFRLAMFKFDLELYEKFSKNMSLAMALLVAWVDPSIRGRLQAFDDPYVAFEWLKHQYALTTVRALELARNTFEKLHVTICRNMQTYINEVEGSRLDIVQAGGTCDDEMVIDKLIRGLSSDYNNFVDQYHYFCDTSDAKYDLPTLTHRLLTFESDLIERKRRQKTVNTVTIRRQCKTCGKTGHTDDRCWQTHPELKLSTEEFRARRTQGNRSMESQQNRRYMTHVSTPTSATPRGNATGNRQIVAMATMDNKSFKQILQAKSSLSKTKCPDFHTQHADLSLQKGRRERMWNKEAGRGANEYEQDVFDNPCQDGVLITPVRPDLSVPQCNLISENASERNKWILDSGANTHAVNSLDWFIEYHHFNLEIATAEDEKTLQIRGGGKVQLTTWSDQGEEIDLVLSQVAFAPNLRCNILSLSQLGKVGHLEGRWTNGHVDITTKDGDIVARALEDKGLYVVRCKGPQPRFRKRRIQAQENHITMPGGAAPPLVAATIDFQDPVWKWHRRLGHLGVENMRRLLKVSEGMDLTDKQIKDKLGVICPVCATTRAIVRIPREPATRRFKQKGELIHLDTWGPYPITGIDDIRYALAITDDATRYTWVKLYKRPRDLVEVTTDLIKKIQRAHGLVVRKIRTDNEYTHDEMKAWCAVQGIHIEFTAAYSQFQNGVAERQFRTERERSAAMLQEHQLPRRIEQIIQGRADEMLRQSVTAPEKLWPEAWSHAVWLKNRAPTRALKSRKTPYETLTGFTPNLARERVWGSRAYVTFASEDPRRKNKPKLTTPRGWLGYFVGCESESIYRIYNPEKGRVYRVAVARIDDGEGLEDPQDHPSRQVRLPDEEEDAERPESPSQESESDSSNSNNSDSDNHSNEASIVNPPRHDQYSDSEDEDPSETENSPPLPPPPPNRPPPTRTDPHTAPTRDPPTRAPPTRAHPSRTHAQANQLHAKMVRRKTTKKSEKRVIDSDDENATEPRGETTLTQTYNVVESFAGEADTELTVQVGDSVIVVQKPDNGWWLCKKVGEDDTGWVPSDFLEENVLVIPPTMNRWPEAPAADSGYTLNQETKKMCVYCNQWHRLTPNAMEAHKARCKIDTEPTRFCVHCNKGPYSTHSNHKQHEKRCSKLSEDKRLENYGKGVLAVDVQDPDTKCSRCRSQELKCVGQYPFDNPCDACFQKFGKNHKCKPQDWKKKVQRCQRCIGKNRKCNGGQPCTYCVQKNHLCRYLEGDLAREYQTVSDKFKEDESGRTNAEGKPICHECLYRVDHAQLKESGCDGELPCNRCANDKNWKGYCAYHQANGTIVKIKLHGEYSTKYRETNNAAAKKRGANNRARDNEYRKLRLENEEGQSGVESSENDDDDDLLLSWNPDSRQNTQEEKEDEESLDDESDSEGVSTEKQQNNKDKVSFPEDISSPFQNSDDDPDTDDPKAKGQKTSPDQSNEQIEDTSFYEDAEEATGNFDRDNRSGGALTNEIEDESEQRQLTDVFNDDEYIPSDNEDSIPSGITTRSRTRDRQRAQNLNTNLERRFEARNDDDIPSDPNNEDYLQSPDIPQQWGTPKTHNTVNVFNSITDCCICIAEMALDPDPSSRRAALQRPDSKQWEQAMQEEYQSLLKNHTWKVVNRPTGRHVLSNRWVLRRKLGPNGEIKRYKARFVVRGFEQVHGIDFDETFAGVIRQPSYKLLFALQARYGWECHQMDVKTAFLHGRVDEDIYIEPPEGFPESSGKVLQLEKALYGLKQAPRQWYIRLREALEEDGWEASAFDHSLFIHADGMYLTVYVDDINIFGHNRSAIQKVKRYLSRNFEMTDLGQCAYYLGMHVRMQPEGTYLHQASYTQQILNKFALTDLKPLSTPVDATGRVTANKDEIAQKDFTRLYQAMIGSINYLATVSRPDIAFGISLLSRYMSNPSDEHMRAVHRMFAYLKETKNLGLFYPAGQSTSLEGWCDSDWGNCTDTARSTSGWIFKLGGPISWSSKRQKTVALSSCEAEYMAATEATKEAVWLRSLLHEMKLPGSEMENDMKKPTLIAIDNVAAMKLSKNPEFHARTKHIAMRHHFIREQVLSANIRLHRVDTKENIADILTKALPRPRFTELRELLTMRNSPEDIKDTADIRLGEC